jgi:hypothetical protein
MKNKIIEALQNKYKQLGLSAKAIEGAAMFLEPSVKEESEIETAITGVEPLLKALQSDADGIRTAKTTAEKRVAELEEQVKKLGGAPAPKPNPTGDGDIEAKLQAMFDAKVKPIQDELAQYKANEVKTARMTLINSKAEKLGIADWVKKHGVVIAEDADEAAIDAKLSALAQDVVTAGLPNGNHFPIVSGDKVSKEEADRIVANMNV